jgi:maleate cis-trans isomerase
MTQKSPDRRLGLLIPSSNLVVESEFGRLMPPGCQAHIARLHVTSVDAAGFATQDADIDYQSRLLGTAHCELVALIQTSASFFRDDYDAEITQRIEAAAGAPGITAAQAVGRAVKALGARRIGLVSPYSPALNANARRYLEREYGLEIVGFEGFGMVDANAIAHMGPEIARAAFARINSAEIEALVLPGGNFATMASIAGWEQEFAKPVVTSNQATMWAALRYFGAGGMPGYGRLVSELPEG